MLNVLRIANLALLILFPIAWFAPLMRAGLLPLFGLSEISVISGMQALWKSDVTLALLVTAFALFAPYLKTIGLALAHFNLLKDKTLPVLSWIGKLAMADVFLIALYIVVIKGGNHANFGNYGHQKGDAKATISRKEQQNQTVKAINNFIEKRLN